MKFRAIAAAVFVACVGFGAACSSSKSPAPAVPVEGAKKSDLSLLVGKWSGDYESKETGRSGSIVFELKSAGAQTGQGDILMWPRGSKEPETTPPPSGEPTSDQLEKMPHVLRINFVRSEGRYVTGTVETYKDPDCQCDVRTTFVGSIDGDVIVGEFTTERYDQPALKSKGTWKVKREKK